MEFTLVVMPIKLFFLLATSDAIRISQKIVSSEIVTFWSSSFNVILTGCGSATIFVMAIERFARIANALNKARNANNVNTYRCGIRQLPLNDQFMIRLKSFQISLGQNMRNLPCFRNDLTLIGNWILVDAISILEFDLNFTFTFWNWSLLSMVQCLKLFWR